MGVTERLKGRSISEDSIIRQSGRVASIAVDLQELGLQAETNSGYKYTWLRYLSHVVDALRAVKRWVMSEQITVCAGREGLFDVSGIAFNTDTWVQLNTFYNKPSFTFYTVKDGHYFFNLQGGGFDAFIAPQAGDYQFTCYAGIYITGITQNDLYCTLLLSTQQDNTTLWSASPITIAGAGNVSIDPSPVTVIHANGTHILRLKRGDRVRFGIKNISRSGIALNSIDITGSEYRVIITKQKFYPTLEN